AHIHTGAAGPDTVPSLSRSTSHQYTPSPSTSSKCGLSHLSHSCPTSSGTLEALPLKVSHLSHLVPPVFIDFTVSAVASGCWSSQSTTSPCSGKLSVDVSTTDTMQPSACR